MLVAFEFVLHVCMGMHWNGLIVSCIYFEAGVIHDIDFEHHQGQSAIVLLQLYVAWLYLCMDAISWQSQICVSCSQQLQAWKLGPSHKITLAVLLLKWKACLEIVQGSWLSTRTSLHKPMAWPAHKKSMLGSRQSAHGTCNSRCDMCYCMSYTGRSLRCSFLYNA